MSITFSRWFFKIENGFCNLYSGVLGMLVVGTPSVNSQIDNVSAIPIVHSVRGYLAFCQNQMPELDIEYIISQDQITKVDEADGFRIMADLWKQHCQSDRRWWDTEALKNEPHPGEIHHINGQHATHPRLTPFQIQALLDALYISQFNWNTHLHDEF